MLGDIRSPRPGRVDQRVRGDDVAVSPCIEHELPVIAFAIRADKLGARADRRAALSRVDRVEHDKARVIDPAVRIDEALAEGTLEGLSNRVVREIDDLGAGQDVAPAEMVIAE